MAGAISPIMILILEQQQNKILLQLLIEKC